jgi:hypothetical protein
VKPVKRFLEGQIQREMKVLPEIVENGFSTIGLDYCGQSGNPTYSNSLKTDPKAGIRASFLKALHEYGCNVRLLLVSIPVIFEDLLVQLTEIDGFHHIPLDAHLCTV